MYSLKTVYHNQENVAKLFVIGIFLLLLVSNCKTIKLLPEYDSVIAQQIDETSKKIDAFFLTLLEATDDEKKYADIAPAYIEIEVELNSILTKNKLRELNNDSIVISENTLKLWESIKNEHKNKDGMSTGNIKINRKKMSDQMFILAKSEGFKF